MRLIVGQHALLKTEGKDIKVIVEKIEGPFVTVGCGDGETVTCLPESLVVVNKETNAGTK